jgi:plasmid stabilization system protein ParE
VHWPFGQQRQDGGSDVATLATSAAAAPAATGSGAEAEAAARIEAEVEPAATGPEAGAEPRSESGLRRVVSHLLAHVVAEIAPGLPTLVV